MRLSNGYCKICLTEVEDFEHMLIGCQGLNIIWARILSILRCVFPGLVLSCDILFFGIASGDTNMNTVVNTILSLTRWNIWKRRCTYKFDSKLKPLDVCLRHTLRAIVDHSKILAKDRKLADLANVVSRNIDDNR